MMAKLQTVGIWLAALMLAMLMCILVTHEAGADGPWLWQEKCPTQHYEVRIEHVERGAVLVSCIRMAEEVIE